jgi:cyclopropane fatty-acyl-phospholipid synthase-like methyltransferase
MSTLKEFQGDAGREHSNTDNAYKGIPMFCDPLLHETCFAHMKGAPKDARILVLGSGGGAFDQRLIDHGFSEVTSLDFRPDFFRAHGTKFVERDLNQDFSDLGTFDVIVAIELIEHLENPAHFLRNAVACLASSGELIVTTPNIESGPSRASFLIQGKLSFFTEADMRGSGHITVLPQHIFAFHVGNAGLTIRTHAYNRSAWRARFSSNAREILSSLYGFRIAHAASVLAKTALLAFLSPLTVLSRSNGNIHVYVLRKN